MDLGDVVEKDTANSEKGNMRPTQTFDMKLEVVVVPVSDVGRAKQFYIDLGWRLDLDFVSQGGFSVVQFTPPGSACSIIFGKGVSTASAGSVQGLHLVVSDIAAVREELLRRGIKVTELFHDAGGVFHHADQRELSPGPNPQRKSYASYASFSDPDGNAWVLQEVTVRLPGEPETRAESFTPEIANILSQSRPDRAST